MGAKEKTETNPNLPAYTTVDNMINLMQALRKKNNDENEAKPISGMADSVFSSTKSALRILGLIEANCKFTSLGKEVAFATSDQEKQKTILHIITSYKPYQNTLYHIFQKDAKETTVEEVINYWGRYNYGTTERNRKEAASLFGNCIEFSGLGKFIKGVQGNPTRIIWDNKAQQYFSEICEPEELRSDEEKDSGNLESTNFANADTMITTPRCETDLNRESQLPIGVSDRKVPTIIVKVDMTNWGDDQIRSFFKYAYGNFD